ncbi:MAG: hypothetical protein VYE53_12205, partial [Planctomycetota bacterium]|nr:hypothetical protein [Planctomycetota bacterium]
LVDSMWSLARLLDLSGCLLGAVNWLRWLWLENRHFENGSRVRARLTQLLVRMENWPPPDSLTTGLAAS